MSIHKSNLAAAGIWPTLETHPKKHKCPSIFVLAAFHRHKQFILQNVATRALLPSTMVCILYSKYKPVAADPRPPLETHAIQHRYPGMYLVRKLREEGKTLGTT
jgi:hypothetical protein